MSEERKHDPFGPEAFDPKWSLGRPSVDEDLSPEERDYADRLEQSLDAIFRRNMEVFEAELREQLEVPGLIAQRIMSSVLLDVAARVCAHLLSNTRLDGEQLTARVDEFTARFREKILETRERGIQLVRALDEAVASGETTEEKVGDWIRSRRPEMLDD